MQKSPEPVKKIGPLFESSFFKDCKDPCPVFDGVLWHIFGSGGDVRAEAWSILHATAPDIMGPWIEMSPVVLKGVTGEHVAAPGVHFDKETGIFHMFIQTDFLSVNSRIEYLTSEDGNVFKLVGTALAPVPHSPEAGLYDPHPSVVGGVKYLVYSGTPAVQRFDSHFVSQPNIYLAQSESGEWSGPWLRLGKILDHIDIEEHHNQPDHPGYEWGIEGPQLIELPDGKVLLNATCFLAHGPYGTRQRVFFALGDAAKGPFTTLCTVIDPEKEGGWASGENGHASGLMHDDTLFLFYQARSKENPHVLLNNWRYGIAIFSIES